MPNTSSAGNVEQNGSQRLNPRQIAIKLIPVVDGPSVRVLDATDEQFEAFIRAVGIAVKAGEEGEKWSFDNRCRAINFALKRGRHLPFVDPNNSGNEQKTIPDMSREIALEASSGDTLDRVVTIVRDEPNIDDTELASLLRLKRPASARFWKVKAYEILGLGTFAGKDEHPLPPTTPSSQSRPYPDLEGEG
jgi:hypothetical protein